MVHFRAKLGEKEYPIDVPSDAKIAEAKMSLEQISGGAIPASQQKWIYQGKILSDDSTVLSCGLLDGNAVHVLKVAGAPAPAPAAPAPAAPAAAMTAPAPAPLMRAFDSAMERLLANKEDVVYNAVGLLSKIFNNIILNPMEDKFRKIKSTNAAFSSKVQSVPGGPDCMRSAGFAEASGEWTLHPSAEGWDLLVACRNKLDLFYDKLNKQRISGPPIQVSREAPTAAPPADPQIDTNAILALLAALQTSAPGADGPGSS